jgi:hypothetical protein
MSGRRLPVDTGVIWSFAVVDALDLLVAVGGGSIDAVEVVRNELRHNSVRESEPRLLEAANHPNITWLQLEDVLGEDGTVVLNAVELVRNTFVQLVALLRTVCCRL